MSETQARFQRVNLALNFLCDRRFDLTWKSRGLAIGSINHVAGTNKNARNAQVPLDPGLIFIPMLEYQSGVTPARMQIAKTIFTRFSRARIPFSRLRVVAQNQRCFAKRGEFPVMIASWIRNFFQTFIAHLPREFPCSLGLANEQIHGGGVDSRPITTCRFVSLCVSFRGAFQKLLTLLPRRSGCGQIFVSAAKHPERFFTGLLLTAQIFQNGVGALGRSAARQSETLELAQPHVFRPNAQACTDNVISEKRLPLRKNPFAQTT